MNYPIYKIENRSIHILDPELGLDITAPFDPQMIPEDLSVTDKSSFQRRVDVKGNLLAIWYEKNGKKEGQEIHFFPNQFEGKLVKSSVCYYCNGLLHGPSMFYYPDGRDLLSTWYIHGLIEGRRYQWFPCGAVAFQERYRSGVMEGMQLYYTREGVVKTKLPYSQGLLNGQVVLFWEEGIKKRELFF